MSTVSSLEQTGLGPRKTLVIMVTVVGCIAFLWPKVFYPMMFAGGPSKTLIKDHRGAGCCDVVLDQDEVYGNATVQISEGQRFRKKLNLIIEEKCIRQERPPHLRPDAIHPAMRERGRNIPTTQTVPIVEHSKLPPVLPKVVEGRPGPIPGMRPPMGSGSVHQPQPKASSMGFLMPLYTIAIVSFFTYTVMKLLLKKPQENVPYDQSTIIEPDPKFQKQVFEQAAFKRPDDGSTKLVVTAIQGLIDAADEQMRRRENATNLSKETTQSAITQNGHSNGAISNGHANIIENGNATTGASSLPAPESSSGKQKPSVQVLNMETTSSVEGGHKWGRPATPSILSKPNQSTSGSTSMSKSFMYLDNAALMAAPPPQSIYLEGSLPHESQLIVTDESVVENILETDDDDEDPAVVLSSKMTLSLISLDPPTPGASSSSSTIAAVTVTEQKQNEARNGDSGAASAEDDEVDEDDEEVDEEEEIEIVDEEDEDEDEEEEIVENGDDRNIANGEMSKK